LSDPGAAGGADRPLGRRRWPEVAESGGTALLVVPVGSLEQHGPHLPLATDTVVALALAEGLAARRLDVVVAPPLPYGASGEHAGFAGTLSVGHRALADFLTELIRSARESFAGVVVVSAHGGNAEALAAVDERSRFEGDPVLVWSPAVPEGDAHAGRTETALMLALDDQDVDLAAAEAGPTTPLAALLDTLRRGGVRAVSPNGVLGDPSGADAAQGRRLFDTLVAELVTAVEAHWPVERPAARR
jgi:mycofactocin precursor peptide peptidase